MDNLSLFVAIPAGVAFLIPLLSHRLKWFPDVSATVTTFILLLLSLLTINHETLYRMGNWRAPYGVEFILDGFSSMMLIVVNLIAFLASMFSVEYIEKFYTSKLRYYSLFLLIVTGMNGTILSGDLFNMFIFLEVALVSSYALVGFGCASRDLEASFKYLVINLLATNFIFLAIALLYANYASVNMAVISNFINTGMSNEITTFAFVLLLVGFATKSAIVPFHGWVADAYTSAPVPVSAILAGGIIKSLGIYVLIRLSYNVFGMTSIVSAIFIYSGTISIIVGVLMALGQWNLKRLLAYHSISQMGYIVLALGIGTPLAILGGIFHLVNHSIFKPLLFFNAGSIEYETDQRYLHKMGKLSSKMPVTFFSSLIASFSISGIPPFNGFWSKLIIIIAAVQAGKPVFALWAVIGSILTLASFSKIQRYAFFGKGEAFEEDNLKDVKEVPYLMRIPMVILAVFCIFAGFLLIGGTGGIFGPVINVLTGGPESYITRVFGK